MRDDIPFAYRPIDSWPGEETRNRQRSNFSAGWGKTLELLMRELRFLKARSVVCQVALDERDFRIRDGHPKSNAHARHPGVVLAFDSKYGPLKYACDLFDRFDDNMRAIALGLEALRAVDRYGITHRAEQYRGWSALPPSRTSGEQMTREEAARVLVDIAGRDTIVGPPESLATCPPATITAVYHLAARASHPDHGGDAQVFRAAKEAYEILLPKEDR